MKSKRIAVGLAVVIATTFLASCGTPKTETGTETQPQTNVSTGLTVAATGVVNETPKPIPVRTIAKEGFNVFLFEDGKKIAQLTQKGNAKEVDTLLCKDDGSIENQHVISYELLSESGTFGVVKRTDYPCGMDAGTNAYYAMNLTDGSTELTDVSEKLPLSDSSAFPTVAMNAEKNAVVVSFDADSAVEVPEGEPASRGEVSLTDLKKYGFVKSGKVWTKTVELGKILSKTKAEPVVAKQEAKIQSTATKRYTVAVEKTHFFNGVGTDQRKGFVLLGDVVSVGEIRDGFGYSEYVNSKGVKTVGYLKMSDLSEGEKKIVANSVPSSLSGKYEISKKGDYGNEFSGTVEISTATKAKYNARWSMNEYGYQEDNPSASRSTTGAGILKMDGPTSGTLSLVETLEETDDAIDSSATGCGSVKAVFRNGTLSLEGGRASCGFVEGVYNKR